MKDIIKYILCIICFALFINMVNADVTPQGSFDMKGRYGIKNMTNVTFTDGSVITSSTGLGNASFNQSLTDSLYATAGAGNASFNQSLTDTLYSAIQWGYNMTTPFTNWLSSFSYNYNQTTPANTYTDQVNSSQSTWIENTFLKIVDMFTKNEITSMISGNRTESESNTNTAILGNVSSLRTDIESNYTELDNNKLDITDQRYNETDWIESQGYLTTVLDDSVIIKYQNISNLPTCTGTDKWTFDGTSISCDEDEIGEMGTGDITSVNGSGIYIYGYTSSGDAILYFNDTKLNLTIQDVASIFNETDWVISQNYLTSYTESDPIFVDENSTIWTAINNRLTLTDQRYNETTIILNINGTLWTYITTNEGNWLSTYNSTYDLYSYNHTQISIDYVDAQGFLDTDSYINDSELPLANRTLPYCGNITGAISNLCTIVDTDTDTQKSGVGYLYNDTSSIYLNETKLNQTIDNRDSEGNLSFNQSLTDTLYASISVVDTDTNYFTIQNGYITNSTTLGINTTELILSGNATLGDKITFRLGEIIDNLVDGWITITGSLNITQNIEQPTNMNFTQGEFYTQSNGTCLNTYKGATLIQSIGCS